MRSAANTGARRSPVWLALVGLAWVGLALAGCSTPPQSPPPAPANLDARLAYTAGKAAYHDLRIPEAIEHLHLAVHLDRDLLEAQDLLVMASKLRSRGPGPPPCAYPAFGGRPDVWAELEPDVALHAAASFREFKRLHAAGKWEEAKEFMRCAEGLIVLESEVCGLRRVPTGGRFKGE